MLGILLQCTPSAPHILKVEALFSWLTGPGMATPLPPAAHLGARLSIALLWVPVSVDHSCWKEPGALGDLAHHFLS